MNRLDFEVTARPRMVGCMVEWLFNPALASRHR